MTLIEKTAEATAIAQTARTDLVNKISAATEALRQATANKNLLVQKSWSGQNISNKALREATDKVSEANDALAFLNEHIPLADGAVSAANAAHGDAVQVQKDADFAVAVRDLITVSRTLTELGKAMATKGAEYLTAYERVILAKSATGVTPNEADQAGYQSARSRIQCVVPLHIQHAIIAGGANHFDVGARDFSHWGRFAAPDIAADAIAVAAAASRAQVVAGQQAFDAAGQEQQARGAGTIPAWMPTEMRGHADPVERRTTTGRHHVI